MKFVHSRISSFTVLLAGGLLLLAASGCSKDERAQATAKTNDVLATTGDKAKELYSDSKAAMSKAWDSVKSYGYEKRAEFAATSKVVAAEMEAQAAKVRAEYSDAKASASRKAAMAELKSSEADYKQKLDALGSATADTWESAKNNVIASWNRFEAALRKASAEK
jgi:hypothetical protein